MPLINANNLKNLEDPERQPDHLELHVIPNGIGRFEVVLLHGGQTLAVQPAHEHQVPGVVTRLLTATAIRRKLNHTLGHLLAGKRRP